MKKFKFELEMFYPRVKNQSLVCRSRKNGLILSKNFFPRILVLSKNFFGTFKELFCKGDYRNEKYFSER